MVVAGAWSLASVAGTTGGEGWVVEGSPLVHNGQNLAAGRPLEVHGASYFEEDGSPVPGTGDARQRLAEQDRDGIDAEVLYPPVLMSRFIENIEDREALFPPLSEVRLSGRPINATIEHMDKPVEQYLDALTSKDWSRLGDTLAEDRFERVGPFCDTVASSKEYVAFLDRVVTPFEQYRVEPRRLVEGDGVVYAEVTESFVHEGATMEFPEVLVFDTRDGLISRVQVYMMRPGDEPPIEGASA